MEHRWGHRVAVDLPIRIVGMPGAIARGWLRDISISGAFIETQLPLRLLSRVYLEPVPEATAFWPVQQIDACVVRECASGVGIEWCEPLGTEFNALLQLASHELPSHASSVRLAVRKGV